MQHSTSIAFQLPTPLSLSLSIPLRHCSLNKKKSVNSHAIHLPSCCLNDKSTPEKQQQQQQQQHKSKLPVKPSLESKQGSSLRKAASALALAFLATFYQLNWQTRKFNEGSIQNNAQITQIQPEQWEGVNEQYRESTPLKTVVALNLVPSTVQSTSSTLSFNQTSTIPCSRLQEWPHPPTSTSIQKQITSEPPQKSPPIHPNEQLLAELYPKDSHSGHGLPTIESPPASPAPSPSATSAKVPSPVPPHVVSESRSSSAPAPSSRPQTSNPPQIDLQLQKQTSEKISQGSSYQANAAVISDISKKISQRRPAPTPPPTILRFRRPSTLGLFGGIALTSTSLLLRRRRNILSSSTPSSEQLIHDACTVVCMHIPFCVSERTTLIQNLEDLVNTAGLCTDAAALAQACRRVTAVVESEAVNGVLEDSTKFAPHVDVFIAQSFKEAERRFCAHVAIEGERVQKLTNSYANTPSSATSTSSLSSSSTSSQSTSKTSGVSSSEKHLNNETRNEDKTIRINMKENSVGIRDQWKSKKKRDYGVVTMVVATMEGVDLKCYYDDGVTNLQKLRCALDALVGVKEGEITGLELLWVPEHLEEGGLSRKQMVEAYPDLRIK